jgi:hypothetical protein
MNKKYYLKYKIIIGNNGRLGRGKIEISCEVARKQI